MIRFDGGLWLQYIQENDAFGISKGDTNHFACQALVLAVGECELCYSMDRCLDHSL